MAETPQPAEVYYRHLEDARRLKWQKVSEGKYVVHLGQTYIGATFNPHSGIWILMHVEWCEEHNRFEYVQSVTPNSNYETHIAAYPEYIAIDELGLPPSVK
jgi:hypothetical protein